MAFTEDLALFFSTNGFADDAVLSGVAVKGILSRPFQVAGLAGAGSESTAPVFTLPTADVPTDPVGQEVEIGDDTYTIQGVQPDGTGVSRLLLEVVR